PGVAEELGEIVPAHDVATEAVGELARPVPGDRSGDVALVVGGGVDVDLDEADVGVLEVGDGPFGGEERVLSVVGHGGVSLSWVYTAVRTMRSNRRGAYQRRPYRRQPRQ